MQRLLKQNFGLQNLTAFSWPQLTRAWARAVLKHPPQSHPDASNPRYCFEAARNAGVQAHVLMLESNEQAVAALKHRFAAALADASAVLVHFTLLPDTTPAALPPNCQPFLRSCSFLVSELLGVAGDNEFMPELLAAARRLFLTRSGLCLPETYTLWVAPLQCPTLHAAVRSLHRCHITGVPPEGRLLAPAKALYSHRCDKRPDPRGIAATVAWALPGVARRRGEGGNKYNADPTETDTADVYPADVCTSGVDVVEPVLHGAGWPAPAMASPPRLCDSGTCHGFLIWFTSRLYKDVVIDSRHTSPARNAFHWEAWVLPVAPVAIGPASGDGAGMGTAVGEPVDRLLFELRRSVRAVSETQQAEPKFGQQRLRLSYSWRCQSGPWHNVAGEEDGVEIGSIASSDSRPGQAT